MPEKETLERAHADAREGEAPSTRAGEFVREEIHHVREGKHGARSTKQAIAIGLSKARRAGVKLAAPKKGKAAAKTRRSAKKALARGRRPAKTSATRSRAVRGALKREGHSAASPKALSRQASSAARRHSAAQRSSASRKAAKTKGAAGRSAAARKAARTRGRHSRDLLRWRFAERYENLLWLFPHEPHICTRVGGCNARAGVSTNCVTHAPKLCMISDGTLTQTPHLFGVARTSKWNDAVNV